MNRTRCEYSLPIIDIPEHLEACLEAPDALRVEGRVE